MGVGEEYRLYVLDTHLIQMAQGHAGSQVDQDPPKNPDSFQLWSTGPDETDQFGTDGSDDIGNWKK